MQRRRAPLPYPSSPHSGARADGGFADGGVVRRGVVAVIDEYVLRRPVGGTDVMRDQLRHLAEMSGRHHIHLHVVPAAVGSYPGLNGAFVVATTPDGDDVAYLDNQLQGHVVSHGPDVLSLVRTWESVRAEALSARQSAELIEEAAQAWT